MRNLIGELLESVRASHETALYFGERRLTYDDVRDLTRRYVTLLHRFGVSTGSRVAVVLPDSPAFVGAFCGVVSLGATAFLLSASMPGEAIAAVVEHTGCTLLITAQDLRLPPLPCRVCRVPLAGLDVPAASGRATDVPDDAMAYVLFSSGSTGIPKGIPHRHADLLHCNAAYAEPVIGYRRDDIVLASAKLSFGYALGCALAFPFIAGASTVLLPGPPYDDVLVAAIARHRPTILVLQPRNLPAVVMAARMGGLVRLRLVVVAGEQLSAALFDEWSATVPHVPLLDGYGTSEINSVFISNRAGSVRRGSVGRSLPGFEVEIRDADGSVCTAGESGELWVRSPSACRWYWGDPVATTDRIQNGWIRTGDLFSRSAGGWYTLHGRVDDMLKVGCGQWVTPGEVESVIAELAGVAESAVVGFDRADGVIGLKAYVRVVGVRPSQALREEIVAIVLRAAGGGAPGEVEFVSDFPRTATGKIDRTRLRSVSQSDFAYQC